MNADINIIVLHTFTNGDPSLVVLQALVLGRMTGEVVTPGVTGELVFGRGKSVTPLFSSVTGEGVLGRLGESVASVLGSVTGEPVLSGRESAAPVLGRVTGEGVLGRLGEGVTPVLSSVTGAQQKLKY